MREKVVLCIVDFKVSFDDKALTTVLADLRQTIKDAYERFTGVQQEELWVVAHHLIR